MNTTLSVNDGAAGLPGTADGTLAEHSGGLNYYDRMLMRKAMRKGVDFLADGLYPDGVFEGFVFTIRPLNHDFCETARLAAMKHFGTELYGEKWDSDGTPDWPPAVTRMIKARWLLASVMSYKGPPLRMEEGDFDATDQQGYVLRKALQTKLCPDYAYGVDWDEEMINDAYDSSDHDEDFTAMLEKMHMRWQKSVDARKFLKHMEDPTQGRFLASPGNSS